MSGPRKPGCAHCFLHAAAALGRQYISRDRLLLRMRPRL
jgi:cytochrome b561